jgi:hypothetical protein
MAGRGRGRHGAIQNFLAPAVVAAATHAIGSYISSGSEDLDVKNSDAHIEKVSAGSGSSLYGAKLLLSSERAHAHTRSLRRAIQQYEREAVFNNIVVNTPDIRELRNTYSGSMTVMGDYKQGRCTWNVFPTVPLDELDESVLAYWNIPSTGIQDHMSAEFLIRDSHLLMRNMSDCKSEVDVWLLWPRADIPSAQAADLKIDYTYFVANDFGTPPMISTPYNNDWMPPPGVGYSTSGEFSTNAPYQSYDWNATPYENPFITTNFRIQHMHKVMLNPGDEIEYEWGMPNSQSVHPFAQLPLPNSDIKDSYPFYNSYAYMKRLGPLVVFRTRGRISHAESKVGDGKTQPDQPPGQAAQPGTWSNFGLFNNEYQLITKIRWMGTRKNYDIRSAFRANHNANGAPYSLNLTTAANSMQWYGRQPFEGASNA